MKNSSYKKTIILQALLCAFLAVLVTLCSLSAKYDSVSVGAFGGSQHNNNLSQLARNLCDKVCNQ